MRLLPESLTGRILLALGLIVLTLLAGSFFIVREERHNTFDNFDRIRVGSKVVTLARLLQTASPTEQRRIIKQIKDRDFHVSLDSSPTVKGPPRHPRERMLHKRLSMALPELSGDEIRIRVVRSKRFIEGRKHRHDMPRWKGPEEVDFSLQLWDGKWLNIEAEPFDGPPPWANKTLIWLLALITLLGLIGIISARRMARPMAKLSAAADQLGRGSDLPPLKEEGSKEMRQTIRAFNLMQDRLQRHLRDRTLMLAAMSHDLRTPITTLRLRTEYIEDEEMRERTLSTLSEMEAIVSAALSFSKDEAADENTRQVDLAKLIQSVCDDHGDLGAKIQYEGPEEYTHECRPTALRRAINNLVENALNYGESAKVSLSKTDKSILIRVDDEGPGIPEEELEKVFTPFFRLEKSRSRVTGGIGLGLTVSRTIVHAHGGRLILTNRDQGGLRAEIQLPI